MVNGAGGDRTRDLVSAIHALSQLSYSPDVLVNSCNSIQLEENLGKVERKLHRAVDLIPSVGPPDFPTVHHHGSL